MRSIAEFVLATVAATSAARPIFAVCADCGKFLRIVATGASTPGISHGFCRPCLEARYGAEVAAAVFATIGDRS